MQHYGLGCVSLLKKFIDLFNKVKPPYNINEASQQLGAEALANIEEVNEKIRITVNERNILERQLGQFDFITKIYPSDANFILAKTNNADKLYKYLSAEKIIVRNRTKESLCENCLRITVGTPAENKTLLKALKNYKNA